MHEITLIQTIAYGLAFALFFALIAKRLGLQPLVGYLVAGIAIGPHAPGFVGDIKIASQLGELGVILLMFAVGLHFRLKDLLAVRSIAIPGAVGQSLAAAICGVVLANLVGWDLNGGLVLGIATSVASTVVLVKVLIDNNVVDSPQGHVAIGWLLVEDIITILVLVLLPILAVTKTGDLSFTKAIALAALKFSLLCVIVMVAGGKLIPKLLTQVARLRSQELFTLTVLVLSISIAAFSYLVFGTSMALGAFLAGMVVGQSSVSHQAASDILPMRDAFAVLFFVAAGMLFDYRVLIDYPWLTLGVLFIVLVVKPLTAFLIVFFFGYPLKIGLTVAAALAQIGEFSFILAEVGKQLKLMPDYGQTVLIASAIVSISLNSYVFKKFLSLEPLLMQAAPIRRWLDRKAAYVMAGATDPLGVAGGSSSRGVAIIVGYGIVGRTVAKVFAEMRVEVLVIEMNINTVFELQAKGIRVVFGDAVRKDILESAGLDRANYLILTMSSIETTMAILQSARGVARPIPTFVRCHYERDRNHLANAGASAVASEEVLVAGAMAENVLSLTMTSKFKIRKEVQRIQAELNLGAIVT
ncbi:MAG TPA: cation:proton antiporter [Oligoflexia bacterium]|nr:cation:proton antiporter [Oligoflexia bacterium]HMP27811.1 cation:proton antiporter [Oligoflexia bacterium]